MGYGGPHAAFFATREDHKRNLPGRLVGVSVDAAGRRALRLALQTREQHIRREKATSNICTAQVLLANIAGMYAVYHGPDGLRAIAERVHLLTLELATGLRGADVAVRPGPFFDTLTVDVADAEAVLSRARERGLNLRRVDDGAVAISLDETTTPEITARVADVFGATLPEHFAVTLEHTWWMRTSAILTHPVFRTHHSETQMLRYLRTLADRDLALDRTMIPLGSCTMKLNATVEMMPITWPGFADVHPFAPAEQTEGYAELFAGLERALCEITGYDRVSLQPNAGSQGELAGLLAIRGYHASRGQEDRADLPHPGVGARHQRRECGDGGHARRGREVRRRRQRRLRRPEGQGPRARARSRRAHGHLPVDPRRVRGQHPRRLRGRARVRRAGLPRRRQPERARRSGQAGQVRCRRLAPQPPQDLLHPPRRGRAGRRPGGRPRAHLAPFLSPHIAAAPHGSAGILPISYAYVELMGGDGLLRATETAILTANYVAARLAPHYPVLYRGPSGLVAHECILDLRPITQRTGVTADDVTKRLVDFGFHAPTVSFPVAGTLMVEPTESEDLAELDRFCDAMIAIRDEIRAVEAGEWPVEESPLRHAPHPAADVVVTEWTHGYTREQAAYPGGTPEPGREKYWPPVSRIDGAFGDRNLVCACPPIEAYAEED